MSDIVNLNEKRADKSGDCRDWTVVDALKAALRDIETGEITMPTIIYIAVQRPDPEIENHAIWTSYQAGGKKLELMGLLAKHMVDLGAG